MRAHLTRRGPTLRAGAVSHDLRRGRVFLVAVGKAAIPMAAAAARVLHGTVARGIVVTSERRRRRPPALAGFTVLVARHPVPDARGANAARVVERLASSLEKRDLLVLLLSGGASALLPAPVSGITLAEKARLTTLLLKAGATIDELNAVRKHVSRLKGGGLARLAAPARVAALVLSDVPGDDLATIASGLATTDPTTYADAVAALRRHRLLARVPRRVRAHLEAGVRGLRPETPKPGDPALAGVSARIVGSNLLCLRAAAQAARRHGLRPVVATSRLEGEARVAARVLVAELRRRVEVGRRAHGPICLLAGGETTVRVRGRGRGGRNQELAVAAIEALDGFPCAAVVASLATDGVDGASPAAGGIADDGSAARARTLGMPSAAAFLSRNDSYAMLSALGDAIVTGPTGTNVADVTLLLAAGVPARL